MLFRDSQLNKNKIKDAHRRIMLANHPDRGGSPYMASKSVFNSRFVVLEFYRCCRINEAKGLSFCIGKVTPIESGTADLLDKVLR